MDYYIPAAFDEILRGATKTIVTDGRIRALLVAYDQALADPKTKIPTVLHAAIEALRRG